MIIVLMGVAGSGKTRVGTLLAEALRCQFLDADSLHVPGNIERMAAGIPLTDADRAPWLAAIHERMAAAFARGDSLVVACSALKESYRAILAADLDVTWVYLQGPEAVIRERLRSREGHFLKAGMLVSQLEALEEPRDAIVADITLSPAEIVQRILAEIRPPAAPPPASA